VDGKPAQLLRCNYLMRGVYLELGDHKVEFRFLPPVGALYVSLAALGVAVVLLGIVLVPQPASKTQTAKSQNPVPAPSPRPQPVAAAAPSEPVAKPSKPKRPGAKSKR
jgi:hypothetical protein